MRLIAEFVFQMYAKSMSVKMSSFLLTYFLCTLEKSICVNIYGGCNCDALVTHKTAAYGECLIGAVVVVTVLHSCGSWFNPKRCTYTDQHRNVTISVPLVRICPYKYAVFKTRLSVSGHGRLT